MSILNILSLYLLFFTLYLFILCIYIFIFIYLYYVYVLFVVFLFALLYSFCFKEKIEKYWRGLSHPKSQAPPRRISAKFARQPLVRQNGKKQKAQICPARRVWLCESINILPTPTKAIVGGSMGAVGGVSSSGTMAGRGPAKKLPFWGAKVDIMDIMTMFLIPTVSVGYI